MRLAHIRVYELIFILIMATEYWLRAVQRWQQLEPAYFASLAVASVLCLAAFWMRWRRLAFLGLAVSHAVLVWREFPSPGNHAYLEIVLCLLGAFLSPAAGDDEQRLYLRSLRWIVVLIFLWSGVQKLVSGYWTNAEYLAYSLEAPSYRQTVGALLSEPELTRLANYHGRAGDGPYRVSSWRLLVLANATWIVEIALAPLLVWRRTRRVAVVGAVFFLAGIESAAREIFFGLVFTNMLLLFVPAAVHRFAVPVFVAILAILTLISTGVLPTMTFY
jgi:hypothetical protein